MTTKFDYCLLELEKVAEEVVQPAPKQKSRLGEAAKVMGSGLAGLAAGHIAGVGAGKAVEYFTGRAGGNSANLARKAVPIIGGAAGIIYPLWQAQQQKAIQDAVESAHNKSDGRVPRQ